MTQQWTQATSDAVGVGPLALGWKEYVDFPHWGIHRVRAKIDTGARTSALDVLEYQIHGRTVRLCMALHRRKPERIVAIESPLVRLTRVRNSSGHSEERPVIEACIRLGAVERSIQVTLTRRPRMHFRMLLGRQALAGAFVVDVTQSYLLRPRKH